LINPIHTGVRRYTACLNSRQHHLSRKEGPGRTGETDLLRDRAVLEEARRDAQAMAAADPGLAQPRHAKLRRMMLVRYGKALELGDVG